MTHPSDEKLAAIVAGPGELKRERDAFAAYALEITRTLTGLTGGGSENFSGKIGDFYKADLPFCAKRIRDREARVHEMVRKAFREAKDAERERDEARAECERLREALTPSAATKFAYIGEFSFQEEYSDECITLDVPWTTIKDIMKRIFDRAGVVATTKETP